MPSAVALLTKADMHITQASCRVSDGAVGVLVLEGSRMLLHMAVIVLGTCSKQSRACWGADVIVLPCTGGDNVLFCSRSCMSRWCQHVSS